MKGGAREAGPGCPLDCERAPSTPLLPSVQSGGAAAMAAVGSVG